MKKLFFFKSTEFWGIPPEEIVYIKAEGNYSSLTLYTDVKTGKEESISLPFQLGHLEDIIYSQLIAEKITGIRFVRVTRSLIVNCSYIHHIEPSHYKLILSDASASFSINLAKRKKEKDKSNQSSGRSDLLEEEILISKEKLAELKEKLEISLIGELRAIMQEESQEERKKLIKRIYVR